jgi:hypothetical protein
MRHYLGVNTVNQLALMLVRKAVVRSLVRKERMTSVREV